MIGHTALASSWKSCCVGAGLMADFRLGLVANVVSSSGTGPGAGPRAGPRREAGPGAAPGTAPGAEAGDRSDSVATCWPATVVVFAWSGGTGRRVDESTSQAGHTPSGETAVTTVTGQHYVWFFWATGLGMLGIMVFGLTVDMHTGCAGS